MAQYDIYDIESRLKQYDPNFSIEWDAEECCHDIVWTHPTARKRQIVMSVAPGQLDNRTYERILMIDRQNGFDPIGYIFNELDQRDKEQEKKIDAMAYDFADNMHQRLVNNYYYG